MRDYLEIIHGRTKIKNVFPEKSEFQASVSCDEEVSDLTGADGFVQQFAWLKREFKLYEKHGGGR